MKFPRLKFPERYESPTSKEAYERDDQFHKNMYGLSKIEFDQLCHYNAEKSRGLLHTTEWRLRMEQLQKRFNEKAAYRRSIWEGK